LVDDDNFSTQGFYVKLSEGDLYVIRCKSCNNYVMPPTSICKSCLSKDLEWVKTTNRGHVVSFSEVHVSNKEYQSRTPYIVAIVETGEGPRIPGIILGARSDGVHIGSPVYVKIDAPSRGSLSRYYFVIDDKP
jgi:uncharacterized protein